MKEFKVGDKVYCLLYGEGEVIDVMGGVYELTVQFDHGTAECYDIDGKYHSDCKFQTLFHLGEQPKMIYPEYEYQVLFKYTNSENFLLTNGHYLNIDEFIEGFQNASDIEHTEPIEKSKRVRKWND